MITEFYCFKCREVCFEDPKLHKCKPSGTERSGAAQPCPPSPTGSAPERSGGAETDGDYLRRSAPVERSDAISRITEWYAAQCNGDWEHFYGIVIETTDNPGWFVKIDLHDSPAQNLAVKVRNDGFQFDTENCRLYGYAEQGKLPELLAAIADLLAADSGQRSAPKAESVATDGGSSGAQARNS